MPVPQGGARTTARCEQSSHAVSRAVAKGSSPQRRLGGARLLRVRRGVGGERSESAELAPEPCKLLVHLRHRRVPGANGAVAVPRVRGRLAEPPIQARAQLQQLLLVSCPQVRQRVHAPQLSNCRSVRAPLRPTGPGGVKAHQLTLSTLVAQRFQRRAHLRNACRQPGRCAARTPPAGPMRRDTRSSAGGQRGAPRSTHARGA
jgi:hypothetical protein